MPGPLDVLVDGNDVAHVLFRMLYAEFSAAEVPGLVAGLAQHTNAAAAPEGDAGAGGRGAEDAAAAVRAVALEKVEIFTERAGSGAPATYAAVSCAEWLPRASGPPAGIGEFAAAVVGEGLAEYCDPWAVQHAVRPPEPVQSDLPVLLISWWFDPITPPSFADTAAEYLSRATHIASYRGGHGVWLSGFDACIDGIVAEFLAEPEARLDTSCAS